MNDEDGEALRDKQSLAHLDAAFTIAFFEQIEYTHPHARRITIICDNVWHCRSKAKTVVAYLEQSRIDLLFLPPYSPSLKPIERFWTFFKRKMLYNRYCEAFDRYKNSFVNSVHTPGIYAHC
jgi:transposase